MALVSYILGNCAGCGGINTFGNIDVYSSFVSRGCGQCAYKERVPLPSIKKKILYLDQFFFSGAFRGGDERFVEAAKKIEKLAANQLLVVPYSSIHEDETHQWEQRDSLFKFIKATSHGHEFEPEYHVERTQLEKAFITYLRQEPPDYVREEDDALRDDVHVWDGYYRIEVGGYRGDIELIRSLKAQSITGLVDLFDGWRASTASFGENLRAEHEVAGKGYMVAFVDYMFRLSKGDYQALFDAPIISQVVQSLLTCIPNTVAEDQHLKTVADFLLSEHFRQTPYHDVSARIYATLKDAVKAGAYTNRDKALVRLSGFFYDVKHIATYAPYCDAIIVDKPMADLLSKPTAQIEALYGCKIFSLQNWDSFYMWLDALEAGMSEKHREGLTLAYPH